MTIEEAITLLRSLKLRASYCLRRIEVNDPNTQKEYFIEATDFRVQEKDVRNTLMKIREDQKNHTEKDSD